MFYYSLNNIFPGVLVIEGKGYLGYPSNLGYPSTTDIFEVHKGELIFTLRLLTEPKIEWIKTLKGKITLGEVNFDIVVIKGAPRYEGDNRVIVMESTYYITGCHLDVESPHPEADSD